MAKRLILSWQTYDWIKYCSGLLIKEPQHQYISMVICKDDRRSIIDCEQLCREAIYAQRRYDLFKVGKVLGVKKLYNLEGEPDIINLNKLVAQIQINIVVGGISEIYYNNNIFLNRIFSNLSNKIVTYKYGEVDGLEPDKKITLTVKEYDKKRDLSDLMVGVNNKKEKLYFSYTEKFYKNEGEN